MTCVASTLVALLLAGALGSRAQAAPPGYFTIRVVDEATGRGVPLVELRTTNDISYITDSNGIVAFAEPGLLGRTVFFSVSSPGYEYPADGFGYRGVALETRSGASATLKLKRINVAERLYRLTGEGIYRDSELVDAPVPLKQPLLNGGVMGQDSVLAVPYRGAIYWFWGDTNRPDYPLGNFGTSGATSPPSDDPDRGINLTYFVGPTGFSRPMLPVKEPGPVWVTGVSPIENGSRLIAYFSRMKSLGEVYERGVALYDDGKQAFDRAAPFPATSPLPVEGHPFLAKDGGKSYLVGTYAGASPLPCVRVAPELAALKDPHAYESYTCLTAAGGSDAEPERDAKGQPVYRWRRDAPALTEERARKLIGAGKLQPGETLVHLRDIETGKAVKPHGGSVYWNAYRRRWVMIVGEAGGGVSNVGEIWFAEADTPVGPWVYARKVATHPKMDFYNPTQHPFLDKDGGRLIYFEGTYVNTFSGNPLATPRYNYNQILYRLTLDDPRLALPAPVYRLASGGYRMREALKLPADAARIESTPFFAVPSPRGHAGLVPIRVVGDTFAAIRAGSELAPAFYALPPDRAKMPETLPLKNGAGQVIGYVWRDPQTVLAVDFSTTALAPGR